MKLTGPFYQKESKGQYKLAICCEQCAFCDEEENFCPLNPCTYFNDIEFDDDEEENEDNENGIDRTAL